MKMSDTLSSQILTMIKDGADYIVNPDGLDASLYSVINESDSVWLCLHNDSCDWDDFTKIERIF